MKIHKITRIFFIAFLMMASCKKFVVVPPPSTSIAGSAVFNNNADAETAINGIYASMENNSFGGGPNGLSILPGLSADELTLFPTNNPLLIQTYTNNLSSASLAYAWPDSYNLIYQANAAIAGIPLSAGMTGGLKNQFLGEALFVRAYCYFYLVNLYGDVPMVTTTAYQNNASLPRAPKDQIYRQIITDLMKAESLLTDAYLDGTGASSTERVRPNKEAVAALLARTYLYNGDWNNAMAQSSQVINSGIYTLESDLNQVFLTSSQEAIWQLELPSNTGTYTPDAAVFLFPLLYGGGPSAYSPIYLSNSVANSFEPGDLRKVNWVDSIVNNGTTYYYPYKYKSVSFTPPPVEYPMMLRYAEQYLIRSEAYAHLGQAGQAIADLNVIRQRAGLPNYSGATDTASVMNAIVHERRVELFTENGHRWLDLKRTGLINSVMGPPGNASAAKGGVWTSNMQLYPIPRGEIQADSHLTQNPGYR